MKLLIVLGLATAAAGSVATRSLAADSPPNAASAGSQMYTGLRSMALRIKAAELGLADAQAKQPYGIVMDMDVGGETATLTSFSSGDASLYLSTGGGMIGGGGRTAVAGAAKRFVKEADGQLDQFSKASAQPRPAAGQVTFYVLTPKGVLGATRPEGVLGEGRDPLSRLFYAGQELITALRSAQQQGN